MIRTAIFPDGYHLSPVTSPINVARYSPCCSSGNADLIPILRTYVPGIRICVRMDAGFASPDMLDVFALHDVDFVLAVAAARGVTSRVYTDTMHQATSWKREYRVVIKAEVVAHEDRDHKDNARYVITNFKQSPHHIYANVYAQRGEIENRIYSTIRLRKLITCASEMSLHE